MSTDIRTTLFDPSPADVALTNNEWYTPRWIFDAAGLVFDQDVAAPCDPSHRTCPAREYLTVVEDGLTAPWHGLVWMNPPYSNPAPWVDRWADHPDGVALLPAANSRWRGRALQAADALALVSINANQHRDGGFGRPDGSRVSYPLSVMLLGRGAGTEAVGRVSARDDFNDGAWFIKARAIHKQ